MALCNYCEAISSVFGCIMGDTQTGTVFNSNYPVKLSDYPGQTSSRRKVIKRKHPQNDMITLEIIRDEKRMKNLEAAWDTLINEGDIKHNNYYFKSNLNAYRQLKKSDPSVELTIVIGRHEGRIVMIWPLVKHYNSPGISQLRFISHRTEQPATLILSNHPSRMAWLERSFMYLISATDCDSFLLENVRRQSLLLTFLQRQKAICIETDGHFSYDCFFSQSLLGQAYNSLLQGQIAANRLYGYVRSACLSLL